MVLPKNVDEYVSSYQTLVILFDLILYVPVNNFSVYINTGLSGLNQYYTRINVSCSRMPVKLEPATPLSQVNHSTTELPLRLYGLQIMRS